MDPSTGGQTDDMSALMSNPDFREQLAQAMQQKQEQAQMQQFEELKKKQGAPMLPMPQFNFGN